MKILEGKQFSFVEKFNLVKEYVERSIPNVEEYISNDLKTLPSFADLIDIDKAVTRIVEAIQKNQKIGIYGDYDVDGATSVATMYHFFTLLNHKNLETYQPNRFIEGYGLHKSSIEQALEDKVDLLITVDCGISNHEASSYAKEKNLDLIITDHHKDNAELELPCALAVVNPNRSDQPESDLKNLSGAGVAFALCCEIRKRVGMTESVYPLLQFVAMSTIADMVKLCPMNAKFIRHGLSQFKTSKFVGIQELAKLSDLPVDEEFIGFKVGPMINAKGRLESPQDALRILISDSEVEVQGLVQKLLKTNEERKSIQSRDNIIVTNKIKKDKIDQNNIMVVYNEKLHQGIVGLLASNVMNKYKKPSIVLTRDDKDPTVIKGSARSLGDFDIFKFISELEFKFKSFGGHKKAGGLSFHEDQLEGFINLVNEKSKSINVNLDTDNFIKIEPRMIDMELEGVIRCFAPYGMGNKRPNIAFEAVVDRYQIMKEKHIKVWFKGFSSPVIFFNYEDIKGFPSYLNGITALVKTNVGVNSYNGMVSLNLLGTELSQVGEALKQAVGDKWEKPLTGFCPEDIEF